MTTSLNSLQIDYLSEGFPAGSVANGPATLQTSWDEILWAAVTVGRPNRQYIFRHGTASFYEAIFRWSLTRMALEQRGPNATRLQRTDAVKTLDPSEKGAVSYFLGMTLSKLFSAKLLNAPWIMHLDVFRPQLNPVLKGRSRPDLVGQTQSGDWVAIESKGRSGQPSADAKKKAKKQAKRLVKVNKAKPAFHIGAITYFQKDTLKFFWRDPEPKAEGKLKPIEIILSDEHWRHYYLPIWEFLQAQIGTVDRMHSENEFVRSDDLDLSVGIHPNVRELLAKGQWRKAREWCINNFETLEKEEYQADGIRVVAGSSWFEPFQEAENIEQ